MKDSVRKRLIDIGATQNDIEEIQKRIDKRRKERIWKPYTNEEIQDLITKVNLILNEYSNVPTPRSNTTNDCILMW